MGLQVTKTALIRLPRLPGFWLEDIYLPDAYYDHKHELVKACDIVLLEFSTDELLDEVLAGEVQEDGGKVQASHKSPAVTKKRFANLAKEDIGNLEKIRISNNANVQTKWA